MYHLSVLATKKSNQTYIFQLEKVVTQLNTFIDCIFICVLTYVKIIQNLCGINV